MGERAESEPELLQPFAQAWEDRNRSAFVRGYKDCKGTEDLLAEVAEIAAGGGFGSIMGRNAFQRPKAEAVQLLRKVMDIHAKAQA